MSHPVALAADTFWLPACSPAPGGGELLSATLVVSGRTTAVIGTGRREDQIEWADTVCSLVDAEAVRWIVLTRSAPDHLGGLACALSAFPRATVAAPWTTLHPAAQRWREVADGTVVDLGGVGLHFVVPGVANGRPSIAVHVPERALLWVPDLAAGACAEPVARVHTLVTARSWPVTVGGPGRDEAGPRITPCRFPRPVSRSGSSATSS